MNLKSLGLKTDLIFAAFDGSIVDRGHYLVVKTPENPNFFWGNFLIFEEAPKAGELKTWQAVFAQEFTDPRIYHKTFAWDSPQGVTGDLEDFLKAGFDFDNGVVLTAQAVHLPPKFHAGVTVRPLKSEEDWEACLQAQIASADTSSLSKEQWENFYRSQKTRYQKMIEAGRGLWFGAFLGPQLVAGLGVFTQQEIARFQIVCTHPDYQRQGICGSLVYHSARFALEKMGARTLVMVADENYHAARIYESVGFVPSETAVGLSWWDKSRG